MTSLKDRNNVGRQDRPNQTSALVADNRCKQQRQDFVNDGIAAGFAYAHLYGFDGADHHRAVKRSRKGLTRSLFKHLILVLISKDYVNVKTERS
jgi:hypothetical protein